MPKYKSQLIKSEEIADGTMAFHFQKPADFYFKAGQAMDVTLINPAETDAEGNTRTFSIIAAPHEDWIGFATRIRDTAFKRTLKAMAPGAEIDIDGPSGDFTLHNNADKPAIMLAGGVGITPFFSMIKDATHRKLAHKIFLFYSNRRPEDAAFLNDLRSLEQQNPNFKMIPTMTDMENSAQVWQGETGYIHKGMLAQYSGDVLNAIYYIAGPPSLVAAMRDMLENAKVDSDNVRFEEFAGY